MYKHFFSFDVFNFSLPINTSKGTLLLFITFYIKKYIVSTNCKLRTIWGVRYYWCA